MSKEIQIQNKLLIVYNISFFRESFIQKKDIHI